MAMFQKNDIYTPAPCAEVHCDAFAETEGAEYKAGAPQPGGSPAVQG